MNRDDDNVDIMAVLRKDTEQDRRNAKKYKQQVGKYQFATHSLKNKQSLIDERTRFARNMQKAKFDKGLKEDRNIDKGDSEYYDYVEITAYGEAIRIFPHTKRVTKFNSKCSLSGCSEIFEAGTTEVVGSMMLCPFSCRFRKKEAKGGSGKESYYYVCASHLPKADDDEMFPSDTDSE